MRNVLLMSAKTTVSILLVYLSLHWINIGALGERLGQFEWGWAAVALLLSTGQLVLLAARWRDIAAACAQIWT